jgi:hypothetical protein
MKKQYDDEFIKRKSLDNIIIKNLEDKILKIN